MSIAKDAKPYELLHDVARLDDREYAAKYEMCGGCGRDVFDCCGGCAEPICPHCPERGAEGWFE